LAKRHVGRRTKGKGENVSSSRSIDDEWDELAKSLCFRDEEHMYRVLYEQEGLSVQEISERLRCGTATLNRRMHRFKIAKKPRGGARKSAEKKSFLFYLDQRVVMALPNRLCGDLFGMSYSMVYNYKRWKAAGSFVGYNLTATGSPNSLEGVRQ
jgi:hypothetical protein